MRKHLWTLSILLFLPFSASAQETQKPAETAAPADSKIPAAAPKQTNPVKPDENSIAQGKKVFGYDCAMCHGAAGDGHGEMAADSKTKVPDFGDPATLGGRSDGDLFEIIQKGKGDMPKEGDRAKPETIWNLVNYVRYLAKKSAAPKDKPPAP
jgi:mono/diheme cytochrome c family protein